MPTRYPEFTPRSNALRRGYSASRPASLEEFSAPCCSPKSNLFSGLDFQFGVGNNNRDMVDEHGELTWMVLILDYPYSQFSQV